MESPIPPPHSGCERLLFRNATSWLLPALVPVLGQTRAARRLSRLRRRRSSARCVGSSRSSAPSLIIVTAGADQRMPENFRYDIRQAIVRPSAASHKGVEHARAAPCRAGPVGMPSEEVAAVVLFLC